MDALIAAFWGFCGAVPYAGTRLATALWSSSEVAPEARKLASAQFAIAMVSGPAFAAAVAPWLATELRDASLEAVAVSVGLFTNAAWPLLTSRAVLSRLLTGFGGWLSRLGQDMETKP